MKPRRMVESEPHTRLPIIGDRSKPDAQELTVRKRLRGLLAIVALSGVLAVGAETALVGGSSDCSLQSGGRAGTEIFVGITYGCEQLEPSTEGSGFVYWVRVDLMAPGVELYVTPMDPTARSEGWQYRLRQVGN